MNPAPDTSMTPGKKALIDYGPLIVFFAVNWKFGIFAATGAFMAAIGAALAAAWWLERKLPKMLLFTAVIVFVFGGLTLWFDDARFIKLKPTMVYLLFAAILFGGYMRGNYLIQMLLGHAIDMETEGWRRMTFRWAVFFVFMALANEIAWRNLSTDDWVSLKVFGFTAATVVFAVAQMWLVRRYMTGEPEDE